jgi:hypothetical protein
VLLLRVINTENEPLRDRNNCRRSSCRQGVDSDHTVLSERVGIAVMLQNGIREDSRSGHRQSSLMFFVLFFSLSRRMWGQYLEII